MIETVMTELSNFRWLRKVLRQPVTSIRSFVYEICICRVVYVSIFFFLLTRVYTNTKVLRFFFLISGIRGFPSPKLKKNMRRLEKVQLHCHSTSVLNYYFFSPVISLATSDLIQHSLSKSLKSNSSLSRSREKCMS